MSAWPLPDAAVVLEGSAPSVKEAFSLVGSPSVCPSVGASGPPGDGSSEQLSSPSLSGDKGRQWSGMFSSVGGSVVEAGAGSGPWHSGLGSYTGPFRPGKQMTARYQ